MPARIARLSAGVGRRHPVTIRKASMMRVWALWHQTGAQYFAIEWTRARVAISRVVAPEPRPEPASRLRSTARDVSFLRRDSRCRRYVSDLSNVTPRYLGSEQKGRVPLLYLTFSSRLASLLLKHDKRSNKNATKKNWWSQQVVDAFCFDTSSWLLNDVQVKWSQPVGWIFAYRIKTWHALGRLGLRQPVTGYRN